MSSTMPKLVVPPVATTAKTSTVVVDLGELLLQRGTGEPPVGVHRDGEQVDVHHPRGVRDRRVRLGAARHHPATGSVQPAIGATGRGVVSRGHQSGQVAEGAALHEHPGRRRRQPGEVGQPAQRLVLGVDGAGTLQPRPAVDGRRAHDEVEQRGGLGRRGRDERQVPRVVHRDARTGQHLVEQPQHPLAPQAVPGDRLADLLVQLVVRPGTVQRDRVQPHPPARVVDDGHGQTLGVVVVPVHARDRTTRWIHR